MKFYSGDEIRSLDCLYNIVIGKRSNGKTFDFTRFGLAEWWNSGKKNQFCILRRWDEDFMKGRGEAMLKHLIKDGNGENQVEIITDGEWNDIYYNCRRWYLCRWDEELNKRIVYEEPFAYGFSLSAMEHDKSTSYPDITNIIFDEMITRHSYLIDEFVLFMNAVSTIRRHRDNVKIWMLGNTVDMFGCPYFDEMGLYNVKQQKPGTIQLYNVGEEGVVRVAVEYCANTDKTKKSKVELDKYFAFDNPHLKMITEGTWEMDVYPLILRPCTTDDIVFQTFICYSREILQLDILQQDNCVFGYLHKKTTPLRHPDDDLIYSTEYDARPNWRRRITEPQTETERRVWALFKTDKVFYQSNQVGELMRSYLQWCGMEL